MKEQYTLEEFDEKIRELVAKDPYIPKTYDTSIHRIRGLPDEIKQISVQAARKELDEEDYHPVKEAKGRRENGF